MKNKQLKRVLHLINTAWLINRKAKIAEEMGNGVGLVYDGQESAEELYKEKKKLLRKIIAEIKRYQLPIKYWKEWQPNNTEVIYFEYCGKQVSFHSLPFLYGNKMDVKERDYGWSGRKNHKLPFRFVYFKYL